MTQEVIRSAHRNNYFLLNYTEHVYRKLGNIHYSMSEVQQTINEFRSMEHVNAYFDKFTIAFGKWLLNRAPRTLEHSMEELLEAFYDYLSTAPDSEQV